MSARRGKKQPLEYSLLLTATLCLIAFGAIMVFSASSATSYLDDGSGSAEFLMRYLVFAALGLVAMLSMARNGVSIVKRFGPALLVISFVLLLAVLIPGIGIEANGASRWIGAGPIQLQPSELAKLALILYTAQVLAAKPKQVKDLRELASPLLAVVAVASLLIIAQPDLGTALVALAAVTALLVVAGMQMRHLALLAGTGVFLVTVASIIEPYRRERLMAFLSPWSDAGDSGFQSVQAMIALGSGGLSGVGLGESVQKVFYLPEAHTDMILAVIGEELGLAGMAAVLVLFGIIAYAGLMAAKRAPDRYQKLLGAGIVSLILCQATLNFFAVLGMAPVTGIPLPFVSYGGSNLVVLLAGMGLLLNVATGKAQTKRKSGPMGVVKDGKIKRSSAAKRRKKAAPKSKGRNAAKDRHSGRGNRRARGSGTRRRRRAAG